MVLVMLSLVTADCAPTAVSLMNRHGTSTPAITDSLAPQSDRSSTVPDPGTVEIHPLPREALGRSPASGCGGSPSPGRKASWNRRGSVALVGSITEAARTGGVAASSRTAATARASACGPVRGKLSLPPWTRTVWGSAGTARGR